MDVRIHPGNGNGFSRQTAEQLLAGLDQLSDEEVDSLLSQLSQEEEGGPDPHKGGHYMSHVETPICSDPPCGGQACQKMDRTNGDGINQQAAEQLLAQLDQLSDEEVDSLLSQMSQKEPD